jgi:hypothetical protein
MVSSILPSTLRAGTRDLPDVPPLVQYLIGVFQLPILTWLSTLVYRNLLRRCADHPLVLLNAAFDFAPVVAACAHFHHAPGTKGSPATYPVELLVRAEFLRSWACSCSDPDLEWLLATNLLARWFVDLPLLGPSPDHTTLHRFHVWMSEHAPDALFRASLAFLDRVDPEDVVGTPQIVDTFAMASPVAPASSPAALLRQLALRLVHLWWADAPPHLQAAIPPLDLGPLRSPGRWRTAADQQAQLQQAVTLATWLADGVAPHLERLNPALRDTTSALVQAIRKVIADETCTDAAGLIQERPASKKGTYRIMSAVDLQATFRKHEGSPAVLGSNAVISTTATRIRAAVALTGSTPDSEAPCAVLRQELAAGDTLPAVLLMDQAAGHGKTRAQADALSQGQTTVVAQIPQAGGADLSRFTPLDFRISEDGQQCTCPNGLTSTRRYPHGDSDGAFFRFRAVDCRGCPLWSDCRDPESKPNAHRSVYLSDYHLYLRDAARFNATDVGKVLLRSRWQVEPTVAWLVRYQGCRQARRVGLAAAQCQLYQACAVRNLLLWLGRLSRGQAPRPTARE